MRLQLHRPSWNGLPSPQWLLHLQLPSPEASQPSTLDGLAAIAGTAQEKTQTWSHDQETWGVQKENQRQFDVPEMEINLHCYWPINGSPGNQRAENGWYKWVVQLGENPTRLLYALLEECTSSWVQVALDKQWFHRFSKQFWRTLVPLQQKKKKVRDPLKEKTPSCFFAL